MSKLHVTHTASAPLIKGQHVQVNAILRRGSRITEGRCSGTFDGFRPSEWDGRMTAYFVNGEINGVAQRIFGFPISQMDDSACNCRNQSSLCDYCLARELARINGEI